MEQIITVIITGICGVLTAAFGFVISYLHKKTQQLEEDKKKLQEEKEAKETEIRALHNGFREYVYKEIKELKTDMKLVKNLVVENKKHYKNLESKK